MWQLETQLFASPYISLSYIFEANYSTLVTGVSKKSSAHQSELEKQLVSDCKRNYMLQNTSCIHLLKKDGCSRQDINDGIFINEKEKKSSIGKKWSMKYFCCITHCHSLSLVVPLVVTQFTTPLSFYKRSFLYCFVRLKVYLTLFVHSFSMDSKSFFDLNNLMRLLPE